MIYEYNQGVSANGMGNFNLPPGGGKYLALGLVIAVLLSVDGCQEAIDWILEEDDPWGEYTPEPEIGPAP